jgi:hypothetical protein
MDKYVNVRVDAATVTALERHAKSDQRSVSSVIRLAIQDYLKKQGRRRP